MSEPKNQRAPGESDRYSDRWRQRDAVIVVVFTTGMVVVGGVFDFFELWRDFVQDHESWELDEILFGAFSLAVLLIWYSWRRQKQSELLKSLALKHREEAHKANLAKSELLASMSHDLRTPLNSIVGFSEMMREKVYGPVGEVHYQEYVELIHESGKYLISLVNDILDLSKIESGEYTLDESLIDVKGELKSSCLRRAPTFLGAKATRISIDAPDELPRLLADKRALSQMLDNLVSNAIKYSGSDAKIVVRWGTNPEGEGLLQVIDTGKGIPAEKLSHITQPFVQFNSSNASNPHISRVGEGVGLGLHIVLRLAELHQASLLIESKVDEGTSATVKFPKERVQ
jgi:two-component system, cell cycle sensor histidine kinase PleC